MMPPVQYEAVVEDDADAAAGGGAGGGEGGGEGGEGGGQAAGGGVSDADAARAAEAERLAEYAKELRKLIAAMEMNFNSGVANLKKGVDDDQHGPEAQEGRARIEAQADGRGQGATSQEGGAMMN